MIFLMDVRLRMYQVLLFKFGRHLCKGSIAETSDTCKLYSVFTFYTMHIMNFKTYDGDVDESTTKQKNHWLKGEKPSCGTYDTCSKRFSTFFCGILNNNVVKSLNLRF